jgi:hypothetical protein
VPDFRFGRLPAQIPAGLRDLTYYAAGPLPKAPASVAIPSPPGQPDGTPWGMDGNSEYGDCGVAGLCHEFLAAAADTNETETFPTAEQVVDYYLTYTGGQDSGVVLSQFLAYVRQNGFYGHSVAAYAPVAVHDVPTLQFCIDGYDAAYVGITVSQGMMDAAAGPAPWTWTAESLQGETLGGHCIILAGYDSAWLYGVTWGQVVRIAYPAWHQMGDEAWAILSGELTEAGTDGHGINLAALQADLGMLAVPAPAPPPRRGLLEEAAGFIRRIAETEREDIAEALARLGL